jgi:predicted component of type VI protein secretion system
MSLFGYGMAYYAAIDLQQQINEMLKLLADPDVLSVFGARDLWGVIDQVAQVELVWSAQLEQVSHARHQRRDHSRAGSATNLDRLGDPTLR